VAKQVAIITGAGSGIGRATAAELGAAGFVVVLIGRTDVSLNETAKLLNDVMVVVADITKPEDVDRVVEQTLSRFGRIDTIVNNAGFAAVGSIEQTTPQLWRDMVDTNLSAAVYLSRAAWPTFRKQKHGVIVNISSLASRDPFEGLGAYGAAKAGLNLLGLSLARQGKAIGVRVHTIAPGAVETAMLRQVVSVEQLPTEQTLSPREVARVVVQCVTGELKHTSGEVIWLSKAP
jgi:NAD(P)-dependent dehydrogenase (short-subunit alcohol dehydrogenase family)